MLFRFQDKVQTRKESRHVVRFYVCKDKTNVYYIVSNNKNIKLHLYHDNSTAITIYFILKENGRYYKKGLVCESFPVASAKL